MPTFLFNKIIREKFLTKILAEKGEYTSTYLNNDQIIQELKLKLKEEAQEVSETQNTYDLLEELSDVLEVIEGLLTASSLTMKDLSTAREAKRCARGKLRVNEKILVVKIPQCEAFEDTISFLRAAPNRYPEL